MYHECNFLATGNIGKCISLSLSQGLSSCSNDTTMKSRWTKSEERGHLSFKSPLLTLFHSLPMCFVCFMCNGHGKRVKERDLFSSPSISLSLYRSFLLLVFCLPFGVPFCEKSALAVERGDCLQLLLYTDCLMDLEKSFVSSTLAIRHTRCVPCYPRFNHVFQILRRLFSVPFFFSLFLSLFLAFFLCWLKIIFHSPREQRKLAQREKRREEARGEHHLTRVEEEQVRSENFSVTHEVAVRY